MSRAENKTDRLMKMEALLLAHPEGMTQSELARHLGVDRSVIHRNLYDFQKLYPTEVHEDGRISIDRSMYLLNVSFTLHEATAVHLAARLLATRMDRQNPHAASALRKLGIALERLAPRISRHVKQAADVIDDANQWQDPRYLDVLEKLTLAWAELRKVKVKHRSDKAEKVFEYFLCPYFIEPYAVGQTTHLIARDEATGKMRTLKIERIEQVELTREHYEIPADFDPRELLADAWGIWYTTDEPVEVTLKFSRNVAGRLKETRWHRSEEETELPDGSILWKAKVAEPQEMIPWIRGWGADCEVVEPKGLREALEREARRMAEVYEVMEARAQGMVYYAHSRKGEDKSNWQLLEKHLKATANLAEAFGTDSGVSELARMAALLHDIGKYSKEFQARLDGSPRKVDHATAGAKEVRTLFNKDQNQKYLADMLAYCIAGHHTGLPDYGDPTDVDNDGTLLARVEKKPLKDYSAYQSEITPTDLNLPTRLKIKPDKKRPGFSFAFLTRMVFSALVDADFQETETYMNKGEKPRGGYASIEELCGTFNAAMRKFDNPQGDINKKRTETLQACMKKAESEQGFFTLTIPTGGGKTLASMAFALNHAIKHGLKRAIYVIPFTSIIEQNAAVFKEHLGENNVLEHHSNFDWKKDNKPDTESADDETKDALDKLKLASENWDIPIVVTTNVQFFESLFANKSSRCRKLHNLAKSVIIFDEAQMLPREYLDPCMLAVKELVQNYGASAVFCTATQPALDRRLQSVNFTELAPDPQALFDFYKRVQITNLGRTPDADLIEKINAHPQALCIVNTRKHAKGLFDLIDGEGSFHLSTLMCPTHRKEVLVEVRKRLKSGHPCRVISTQVMEAGIDVDFPVGFRALAGLDSIIQAAGRVNREMKQAVGDVYVFDPETPFIKKTPTFIKQGAAVAESILRDFAGRSDSKEAIENYFNFLYNIQSPTAFDAKNILAFFDKGSDAFDFDFKTAAENFRMIDNNTVGVVIPYNDEAKELLQRAKYHPFPYTFARQLQMYTVNIYENEFEKLQSKGVIETINDTYEALTENSMKDFYNEKTGLVLPADAGGDALFFD
jgi:CRISPR-associated endonuclease/helicase Cas3